TEHNVTAKHSLEGVCARVADVFTTVSEITADEAELLHGRRPEPLLPNGIDLAVVDEIAGKSGRADVRARLTDFARRFLGEDIGDAALLCISGRYEFHNKGINVVLDALAEINRREGRRAVLFVLVPAGNSGLRSEVLERRDAPFESIDGPVGIATHHLFDEEHDAVHTHCRRLGLDNEPGSRVKVIQVPVYLGRGDGFLDEPYEAVLRAMDLSCFPSYYEPWGYTPQESLAVGVPTITSDYAGFGRWARKEGLGPTDGITVLPRVRVTYKAVVESMVGVLEEFFGHWKSEAPSVHTATCRATAARTSWSDLFANYEAAYARAADAVVQRGAAGVVQRRSPRRPHKVQKAATPRLTQFDVAAKLPEELRGLTRLANNYWWSWDAEATALFADPAPQVWAECRHNPVAFLQRVGSKVLDRLAADRDYTGRLASALARLEDYLTVDKRTGHLTPDGDRRLSPEHPVAYFSAEFGIHESMPIYSGGLGILAGDHLKSASDLGLPLVGIGMLYRMGYMHQQLTATGEQTEVDRENDPRNLPLECVRTVEGAPLEVTVQLPARRLYLRAWRVRVGRVSLYLLDANTPSNSVEDRDITRNLYGGAEETRILQEIVLGRGGARLLRRLGIRPAVYHMNEGHAAFLTLERVSRLVREEGLTFDAAREIVRATTVFTTHTPVPAGHDRFHEDLVRRYFADAEGWVGVPWERFFDLGRDGEGQFNMTYLALSFASMVNGVSKLHGTASRALLGPFWPGLLEAEVPIHTVTNGIHVPTWTAPEIVKALDAGDQLPVGGAQLSRAAEAADPKRLWAAKAQLKQTLLEHARASIQDSFVRRNDSPLTLHRILEGLSEDALLIGFARRFAPYKRAHLLFADIDRLQRILNDPDRPVRILVAGKAHPRDTRGKDILRDIADRTRGDELIGRVFFLENYDIELARSLVQGVDVWLNNPIRMLEASGTSGMKAAANGGLNLSIGDGWWPEAFDGDNGWTIAGDRVYADQKLQDQFDSAALYRLLEEEVVPTYFDRDPSGVPAEWVRRMVHDLQTIPRQFNTDRMVQEYVDLAYRPLGLNYFEYVQDLKAKAKHLAVEAKRIRQGFGQVRVVDAQVADLADLRVGETIDVRLDIDLGPLAPEDVRVELVVGQMLGDTLGDPTAVQLAPVSAPGASPATFEGSYRVEGAGHFGHGLRVRARHGEDIGGALKDLTFWV
ncbi:MAG: alpha-glucan family phosphorylase, partial [Planctomycetes bacterium]|nr:alpha-glucan family phosphorylase [Planctomycetota bacterium]